MMMDVKSERTAAAKLEKAAEAKAENEKKDLEKAEAKAETEKKGVEKKEKMQAAKDGNKASKKAAKKAAKKEVMEAAVEAGKQAAQETGKKALNSFVDSLAKGAKVAEEDVPTVEELEALADYDSESDDAPVNRG